MKGKIFMIISLCIFVTGILYGCVEEGKGENEAPTCILAVNPNSGTVPLTVTFTITASDSDGNISSWELDIDNDGTADYNGTGNPPAIQEHTYDSQGSYTAKLTVTGNEEKTGIDTILITVNKKPPENQSPTCTLSVNPASGYAPLTVTFSMDANDPDGSIASWSLDTNNDGTVEYSGSGSPSSTLVHTYTNPGTYTTKLMVTDNQRATDTDTIIISVTEEPSGNQPPTCSLTVNPSSGYAPLSVTFSMSANDPDGSISSWELDINNDGLHDYTGSGNPASSLQHTYTNTGTYTAKLTVTDDQGATASYTRTITVSKPSSENQSPTCSLAVNPTSGTVPLTATFTMSASDPDGTITTWSLDTNNDGTSDYAGSGTPPGTRQHIYHTIGTYTANLTVTDNQGAPSSDTKTITVSQASSEKPPEIYLAITANNVEAFGNYSEKSEFERGDTVYVYYEYREINHENVVNTYHTITVNHKDSGNKYHSDEYEWNEVTESQVAAEWWWFDTDDSWPTGQYQVDIEVLDQITEKTSFSTIYFTLTDVSGSQGYSRSNPAPIGSTLVYEEEDDWLYGDYRTRITLVQVIRGMQAWIMIEDANMFNDEPDPGYEYILTKIRFEYLESSEQDTQYDLSSYDFTVVSEGGVDYDVPFVVEPEPDLDGNLYPGATVEGWAAYQVAITDNHPLLTFGRDWLGKGGIWFKLY